MRDAAYTGISADVECFDRASRAARITIPKRTPLPQQVEYRDDACRPRVAANNSPRVRVFVYYTLTCLHWSREQI